MIEQAINNSRRIKSGRIDCELEDKGLINPWLRLRYAALLRDTSYPKYVDYREKKRRKKKTIQSIMHINNTRNHIIIVILIKPP